MTFEALRLFWTSETLRSASASIVHPTSHHAQKVARMLVFTHSALPIPQKVWEHRSMHSWMSMKVGVWRTPGQLFNSTHEQACGRTRFDGPARPFSVQFSPFGAAWPHR